MKIGFFTDTYFSYPRHGVETSIYSFRKCLKNFGQEVFIIAPKFSDDIINDPYLFTVKSLMVMPKPHEMRLALPIPKTLEINKVINLRLDIIHAQTPFSIGILGKIISKKQKIPFLYTHHTDLTEYARVYLKEKRIMPYITNKFISWFSNMADAIIVPSIKVKENLDKIGVDKPIHVIPNGIDINIYKRDIHSSRKAKEIKDKLGIKPEEKVMLYFGRAASEKNIEYLIDVFSIIVKKEKSIRFLICGNGPHLGALEKKAEECGLSGSIIFGGFVHAEIKHLYYQLADIFVFASKTETQGLVVLEAMASGLPVVALEDGALYGMVQDGKNGYFVKDSKEEFARNVVKILANKKLYEAMSNESLRIVEDFSEDKETEKLIKLYESISRS